ncbi:alpha/beta hydrolase-fold protein [Akkermansiaceae bacterium]|nr:alpha/beta hydrolase-fold protein [Akkermansiaceae bacterium]MDA7888626.1 alpha/beta hydrolase-fold protein [Akkermansiaceae bacterium]MDB4538263.1 alpha/beta hydrolase-fold protein [Akkermansiaceae bacterium]
MIRPLTSILALTLILSGSGLAQKKKAQPFKWVNAPSKELPPGATHGSFQSPSMKQKVGYVIYLPPSYSTDSQLHFPVVYHLHGGRPGSELKSVNLARYVDKAIKVKTIKPTIYVFPNGGPMSWYNYPQIENGSGEDVFVNELIPHIDKTYRTIAARHGRAIEGFSQGGRGTTRIMLKYPELFCSAAPGGSGYEPEQRIRDNNGAESEHVRFAPGYNTWDLAKQFSQRSEKPKLPILLWVGTKGFNYEFNLKFSTYLKELKIPHSMLITEGAKHSASEIYQNRGDELMKFHQQNFTLK